MNGLYLMMTENLLLLLHELLQLCWIESGKLRLKKLLHLLKSRRDEGNRTDFPISGGSRRFIVSGCDVTFGANMIL